MEPAKDGYEDSRFHGDVGRNLHCLICFKVLNDPVQCRRNQHLFCTQCILRHLKLSHTCPICLEQLTPDTLEHPPRIIADLLSSLKITCDYAQRGCREVVELGVLKRHVKHCKFASRKSDFDSEVGPVAMRQTSQQSDERESRSDLTYVAVAAATVLAAGAIGAVARQFSGLFSQKGSSPPRGEGDQETKLEDYEFPSDSEELEEEVEIQASGHSTGLPPKSGKLYAEAASNLPRGSSFASSATSLPRGMSFHADSKLEEYELMSDSDDEGIESHACIEILPRMEEHSRDDGVSFKGVVQQTKTVGQDGGEVLLDDISLIIPRHSLKDQVNIKVTHEDSEPYQSLLRDAGLKIDEAKIEHVIKLEPPGIVFDSPASVRIEIKSAMNYSDLFILHGTRDIDGFIEWEDVTSNVLIRKPDKYASAITLMLKTFCRYATVRSRFNVPGRILDSLNCKFQTRCFSLFKRPASFPQRFDTRVVFMTDKVFRTANESSQAYDLINHGGFRECDRSTVKKVYTNRDLDIHCEVFGADKELKTSFHVSSSRLNQIGDVFEEFSNVENPRITKGHFVITQKQREEEKHLWTLRFWDEENIATESPKEIESIVKKEEEQNNLSKVPNSGILTLTEMETLSTVISTKWENLARLLNVDYDLVEQTRLKYPDSRSKAVEILKIFNSDPKAHIDDLFNALSNLGITVPQDLTAVKNHRTHLFMYEASAISADMNSSVPTECNGHEEPESMTNASHLSGREIEMLSRCITTKWCELGRILNIAQHEIDDLIVSLLHPNATQRAAQILRLYNEKPDFTREELGKSLEEIHLPDAKEKVMKGELRQFGKNGVTV